MNTTLLFWINDLAGNNQLLDAVMIFCAKYLIFLVFMVTLGCIGYFVYRRQWQAAVYFFASLVVSFIILKIAALFPVDHRPFMDHQLHQLIAHAPGNSFPSDHTTVTAAIGFGLLFFTQYRKIGYTIVVVAVLIGFARIFVGVHYPADIIGGLVTGLIGAGIVFVVKKASDSFTTKHIRCDDRNNLS